MWPMTVGAGRFDAATRSSILARFQSVPPIFRLGAARSPRAMKSGIMGRLGRRAGESSVAASMTGNQTVSFPQRITISEVGPRDGLQIEKAFVPTEEKIALVDALSTTGLDKIEITGFVHPKVVPQHADAERVAAGIRRRPGVRYAAFIPNAKGAERAVAAGIDDLKVGMAASDTFNELNVRMTTAQGMQAVDDISGIAKGSRSRLVGAIPTA